MCHSYGSCGEAPPVWFNSPLTPSGNNLLSWAVNEGILLTRVAALTYAMGRKIAGHNTWFGKD